MLIRSGRRVLCVIAGGVVLGAGLLLDAGRASAQTAFPLTGAPYAAGVSTAPGSTLAVMGGIEGSGADTATAGAAALKAMETRLTQVGLTRANVVRVRAALAPAAATDFTAWNTAWTAVFSGNNVPARVTVGGSALPGTARVVLDVVAVFPADRGYPASVTGARATPNPNLRLIGPATNPTSIVWTASGLFLSAGVLPNRQNLADPESMEQHIRGAMNALTTSLGNHGLQWSDAFFVRVLPTPQPNRTGVDFAGWTPVFASLGQKTQGLAPTWSMWAAPGASAGGRYVETEVWAVPQAPHPVFQAFDAAIPNRMLKMSGNPTGAISSGALIAPHAELIFLSGIIAPEGTAPEDEGKAVLTVMAERLKAMNATMADVAELRVYRVAPEAGFNTAYGGSFNNAEVNPHKPVRTNWLVESLPAGRLVEIEAIVVRPPTGF